MLLLLVCLIYYSTQYSHCYNDEDLVVIDVPFPRVDVVKDSSYMVMVDIPRDQPYYLVSYEYVFDNQRYITTVCLDPKLQSDGSIYESIICQNGTIECWKGICNNMINIFAAQDQQKFEYPEGLGMRIDLTSNNHIWYLRVHFLNEVKFSDFEHQLIGYRAYLIPESANIITRPAFSTKIILSGQIIPGSIDTIEYNCTVKKNIHVFSYIAHSHDLAEKVDGYKILSNGSLELIGRNFPQQNQLIKRVENPNGLVNIDSGDKILVRCIYNANLSIPVFVTDEVHDKVHEMCIYFISYYTDDNVEADPQC